MSAAASARAALVDGLVRSGRVRSGAVEEALRAVPRHLFLPGATPETAYADDAVAVQRVDGIPTSSASQPSMVAIMLEQLDLRPGQRVLEIGAGTGWNAALMARLVGPSGHVTTVDIDAELVAVAQGNLAAAGADAVVVRCGDGVLGDPGGAPYDRIVLTVGSGDVWPAWVEQLAPGGRLLLPLAVRGSQLSVALDLGADGLLHSASVRSCGFIRLRGRGAVCGGGIPLLGEMTLHPAVADPAPDAAALTAALAQPGEPVPLPVSLSAADVWDGFGLWLALTEPGAGRLVGGTADGVPGVGLPGPRIGAATVVLATAAGADRAGMAVVVAGTDGALGVRGFGLAGAELTARLLAAVQGWVAAGPPCASDLTLTVVPAARRTAGPSAAPIARAPRTVEVPAEHAIVRVTVPRPP